MCGIFGIVTATEQPLGPILIEAARRIAPCPNQKCRGKIRVLRSPLRNLLRTDPILVQSVPFQSIQFHQIMAYYSPIECVCLLSVHPVSTPASK